MLNKNGPNIGDGLNFVTCEHSFSHGGHHLYLAHAEMGNSRTGSGLVRLKPCSHDEIQPNIMIKNIGKLF